MAMTLLSVLILLALSGHHCLQQSSDSQDTLAVDKIEARLAALESKNDAFKIHVSVLENKNNALEGKLNVLENKNDALENKSEALETQVLVLEGKNNALQTQVNVLENKNNALLNKVDVLKNRNSALEDLSSKRVSFHARTWDDIRLPPGSPVVLPTIVTNQGNAYNATSGAFTAPFPGTYCFLASTETYTYNAQASMSLMVGQKEVAYVHAYHNSTNEAGEVQATVHLPAGQTVWLKSGPKLVNWYDFLPTKFTGFLVSPDP